jgi:hypothetical protein
MTRLAAVTKRWIVQIKVSRVQRRHPECSTVESALMVVAVWHAQAEGGRIARKVPAPEAYLLPPRPF